MKNSLSNPTLDGCGPYGRHLSGVVNWQKYYPLSNSGIANGGEILAANVDWACPVPPPSEAKRIDAIRCFILGAGTASFIRMAIYEMIAEADLRLLTDTGEAASDTGATMLTLALGAAVTLAADGRYVVMITGRGAALPTILCTTTIEYAAPSFLGKCGINLNANRIKYARAYAAFPAVYNGVFASVDSIPIYSDGRLP